MNPDADDSWSDTSSEDNDERDLPLQSRAYQLEMFELSMQENIICVVGL